MRRLLINIPRRETGFFSKWVLFMRILGMSKEIIRNLWNIFRKLIKYYPESGYRKDSEMMIFHINNVTLKDKTIAAQQTQIETLQQEVKSRGMRLLHCKKRLKRLNKG